MRRRGATVQWGMHSATCIPYIWRTVITRPCYVNPQCAELRFLQQPVENARSSAAVSRPRLTSMQPVLVEGTRTSASRTPPRPAAAAAASSVLPAASLLLQKSCIPYGDGPVSALPSGVAHGTRHSPKTVHQRYTRCTQTPRRIAVELQLGPCTHARTHTPRPPACLVHLGTWCGEPARASCRPSCAAARLLHGWVLCPSCLCALLAQAAARGPVPRPPAHRRTALSPSCGPPLPHHHAPSSHHPQQPPSSVTPGPPPPWLVAPGDLVLPRPARAAVRVDAVAAAQREKAHHAVLGIQAQ